MSFEPRRAFFSPFGAEADSPGAYNYRWQNRDRQNVKLLRYHSSFSQADPLGIRETDVKDVARSE